jgi:predicted dehydrogenase
MKFLVVGLGSMGKRRIRNLKHLKAGEILGFDLRADRRQEAEKKYGIKTLETFEQAMSEDPDALIISTPPDQHLKYALTAARNEKHFFVEASVLLEGMDELIALCEKKDIVAAPSRTMQFHPSVKLLKEIVEKNEIGKVLTFTHHLAAYLPDWHPWEDYRSFYISKKETGGCREMVAFELVWLTWLFGEIKSISCLKKKLSNLKADIDDAYQVILDFEKGPLGHMLIDVGSRVTGRECKLMGEEGMVVWDSNARSVKVFRAGEKKWKKYPEPEGAFEPGYAYRINEEMYIEEMAHFIKAIKGEEKYTYSLSEDKKVLEILQLAERSSEEGICISLSGGK